MSEELVAEEDCDCRCHHVCGIHHVTACCTGLPVDFWDEYEEVIEQSRTLSSRPKGKSPHDEPVDEWMSFINSKRTGKPLRGPGSDSYV